MNTHKLAGNYRQKLFVKKIKRTGRIVLKSLQRRGKYRSEFKRARGGDTRAGRRSNDKCASTGC